MLCWQHTHHVLLPALRMEQRSPTHHRAPLFMYVHTKSSFFCFFSPKFCNYLGTHTQATFPVAEVGNEIEAQSSAVKWEDETPTRNSRPKPLGAHRKPGCQSNLGSPDPSHWPFLITMQTFLEYSSIYLHLFLFITLPLITWYLCIPSLKQGYFVRT